MLAEELRPDGASVGFGGVDVTCAPVTVAKGDQCQAVPPFVAERLDAGSGDSVEVPHVDVGRAARPLPQSVQRCCCVSMPTGHEIDSDSAAPTVGTTRRVPVAKGRVVMLWRIFTHGEQKPTVRPATHGASDSVGGGPLAGRVIWPQPMVSGGRWPVSRRELGFARVAAAALDINHLPPQRAMTRPETENSA